jgi:hypothetical protein
VAGHVQALAETDVTTPIATGGEPRPLALA